MKHGATARCLPTDTGIFLYANNGKDTDMQCTRCGCQEAHHCGCGDVTRRKPVELHRLPGHLALAAIRDVQQDLADLRAEITNTSAIALDSINLQRFYEHASHLLSFCGSELIGNIDEVEA